MRALCVARAGVLSSTMRDRRFRSSRGLAVGGERDNISTDVPVVNVCYYYLFIFLYVFMINNIFVWPDGQTKN